MTPYSGADIVFQHFPYLSDRQKDQFRFLEGFYNFWNPKINLISRKDVGALYTNHVLHSLAIAKYITFQPGTSVLDVGTGGGFPGIPLAIFFPEVNFHLVDSIGKKVRLVQSLIKELKLQNAIAKQQRAEQLMGSYDYIVSRAVTSLPVFCGWVTKLLRQQEGGAHSGGILYLKGGEFSTELDQIPLKHRLINLDKYFDAAYFNTKKLVHLY